MKKHKDYNQTPYLPAEHNPAKSLYKEPKNRLNGKKIVSVWD